MKPTAHAETERLLEDILVKNPEMLMPGLTLVGRQMPTEARGWLDLLGVDSDGRLVVFELKRGSLTRDAVTQVIDYCSALELWSDEHLAAHIAEQSRHLGIHKIEDMAEWYRQRFQGELESLRPIRMALVGLGSDDSATRMADYLRGKGVDISLLTYYGYQYEAAFLLAKQVAEQPASDSSLHMTRQNPPFNTQFQQLDQYAAELGISQLWEDAKSRLRPRAATWEPTMQLKGLTSYLPGLPMEELDYAKKAHGSHSIRLDPSGKLRVTFFPAAIELCFTEFTEQLQTIPFKTEPPPNAPTTARVQEQWYCLLDEAGWKTHTAALQQLANAVNDVWINRLNA